MSFSQAQLAAVAYAQVSGADGSSTLCNSGVVTSKISTGYYSVTLPNGTANTQALAQNAASDLVVVTPTSTALAGPTGTNVPAAFPLVNNSNPSVKYVAFQVGSSSCQDTDFSIAIFRTLTP